MKTMLVLQQMMLTQMYVEERLAMAAREHLVQQAEQAAREARRKIALKARLGRTLVSVGQRLETAGAA
ncbi:MAG: hypothetical protein ACR2JW_09405 [Thermomicrobiales bacterium]